MKKILTLVLSFALACASMGAFAGCGSKDSVTISGSSSVSPIIEVLAAEYEKTHDIKITVNTTSSGAGISDTQKGLNDFGMSSRALEESETGITGTTLCMDGIVLIVNKNCDVTNVNSADVKALFENGTAIPNTPITAAIGRTVSSGTRKAFDELLNVGEYKNASTLEETGNVIEVIKDSTNSIGYISFGSLKDNVKAVSLDGVACTLENIISGEYLLQRPFVIVLKKGKQLSEKAQGFYDYIMSEEAQALITSKGYVSVR